MDRRLKKKLPLRECPVLVPCCLFLSLSRVKFRICDCWILWWQPKPEWCLVWPSFANSSLIIHVLHFLGEITFSMLGCDSIRIRWLQCKCWAWRLCKNCDDLKIFHQYSCSLMNECVQRANVRSDSWSHSYYNYSQMNLNG